VSGPELGPLSQRLRNLERDLIEEALRRAKGNQSQAAKLLGIGRPVLVRKLSRLRLRHKDKG
jgi:arginine utilization regulatory protein